MRNVIAFQKNLIVVPNASIDNRHLAMITQAELMKFGYMLDEKGLDQLGHADKADIVDFHNEVIDYLKEMTGGKRDYQPIYKGFPTQVMEMSDYELWVNQLIGYWTGGSFKPDEWTKTKGTAFEYTKYRMINSGTEEQFKNIFKSLVSSGTSLTPADLKVVVWFVKNYVGLEFPDSIPFKENLCTVFGTIFTEGRQFDSFKMPKLTTTDVLRIAVHMSGGDISLSALPPKKIKIGRRYSSWVDNPARESAKFKKFSRKERKFLLGLLENSNLDVRDMKLKDQRWIRLGEILHPGEYKAQFPRTYNAFNRIRNDKVKSWYGEVNSAFLVSFEAGLAKLSERPGEFLRRLDWLIRSTGQVKTQQVLDTLAKVGMNSSNKVLFEVYDHFEKRKLPVTNRKVMIKGARKHTTLPNLSALSETKIEAVQSTVFNIIKSKIAALPAMGDCWIDEELKKIPLPTNMRSLNDTLVPVIRGQRTPFGEGKKVIRSFIHWFDEYGRIDLDLHGYLFGSNSVTSFGFNGNRSVPSLGCYSGDVICRRGACAEYVDINVDEALKRGYKYFIMIIHNFRGGKLSDIKECVAGVMEREFPEANRTWLPETITNSMKLSGGGNMVLVAAYDLETRESIYLDLDFSNFQDYVYRGQSETFFDALKPYLTLPALSVYDLLSWHVEARGRLVSKETAETHFLFDDFASSYIKTIEYMGV